MCVFFFSSLYGKAIKTFVIYCVNKHFLIGFWWKINLTLCSTLSLYIRFYSALMYVTDVAVKLRALKFNLETQFGVEVKWSMIKSINTQTKHFSSTQPYTLEMILIKYEKLKIPLSHAALNKPSSLFKHWKTLPACIYIALYRAFWKIK